MASISADLRCITTAQWAAQMGFSVATANRWLLDMQAKHGVVPIVRPGTRTPRRWRVADIERVFEQWKGMEQ